MSAFTCPDCGRTSNNPRDAEESYCAACAEFKACPLCGAAPVAVRGPRCPVCDELMVPAS